MIFRLPDNCGSKTLTSSLRFVVWPLGYNIRIVIKKKRTVSVSRRYIVEILKSFAQAVKVARFM